MVYIDKKSKLAGPTIRLACCIYFELLPSPFDVFCVLQVREEFWSVKGKQTPKQVNLKQNLLEKLMQTM